MTKSESKVPSNTFDLHQFQWRNRLLLIFAPSPTSEVYIEQQRLFHDYSAALDERDMIIGSLFEQSEGYVGNSAIQPVEASALRTRFKVGSGSFTALLVGKDGGVKEHFETPVTPEQLFAIIDAMPMRRQEMMGNDS